MSRTRVGYKGGAKATTLNGTASSGATSIVGVDLSTWSGATTNGPGKATINRGLSDEEVVYFTGISTNTLTGVTRGKGGTSDQTHATGTLEHTPDVSDFDEANELVAAMANNSCRVYNDANISVTDSAFQALTFNSERFDTGGLHSTSANTARLTAVTAGKYLIFGGAECATNATGERIINLRLNGTTFIASATVLPSSANATRLSIATVYPLAAADFVELLVFQSSGGFLNVNAAGNYSPEFGCALIGL